jgi:hypothetical protein
MRFRAFLDEARKKKEPEDTWHKDYESGYSRLRDMQEVLVEKNLGLQLFVPKHRDPEKEKRRASEYRYNLTKREMDAEAEKLKEDAPPILSAYRESPPGSNKPSHGFWTSSAKKKSDGTYTSAWYEFVKNTFKEWQTDYGYLFEIKANTKIFDISYAEQYYQWAMDKGRMTKPAIDSSYIRPYSQEDMRYRFPWDSLSHHFDAAHCYPYRGEDFTYGWDVESTVWFNTSMLTYKGAVKLFQYGDDDED